MSLRSSSPWSLIAALASLLLVIAAGTSCSVDYPRTLGEQCELASECAAPLVCRLGRCRNGCRAGRDCGPGVSCAVDADMLGGCLLPEETRCGLDSECPAPLVCRMGVCANDCLEDVDCPDGAECRLDVFVCAEGESRCLSAADCSGTMICGPFGSCIAECRERRDCAAGDACRDGACVEPALVCSVDADCEDGAYCNGEERCDPLDADADVRGCAPPDGGPVCASDEICDEVMDSCLGRCAADADADGDGQDGVECGGLDCNDDDPRIYSGATESCNTVDDDCDVSIDETFDLTSDEDNCGACGTACPAGGTMSECISGVCDFSCAPEFRDCDGDPANGCEIDTSVDALNCGACGVVCEMGLGCVAGVCTVTPIVEVAAGRAHACARRSSGGVVCWGDDSRQQLGRPVTAGPADVLVGVDELVDATALSAGANHTCALLEDQTVVCWGENDGGQLGDGSTTGSATPVAVRGPRNVVEIGAGGSFSCARTAAGVVACWGSGESGPLGATAALSAVAIPGLRSGVEGMMVGQNQLCGFFTSRDATCLGFGVDAFGTAGLVRGATQGYHACAIDGTGTLRCWARVSGGAASATGPGAGPRPTVPTTPVGLAGTAFVDVGVGSYFSCALSAAGAVYCVGENDNGQIGDGSNDEAFEPVEIATAAPAVNLAVGQEFVCAVLSDGRVQCWGANGSDQLGPTATGASSNVPVRVGGLP